jgi:hypothetical protein
VAVALESSIDELFIFDDDEPGEEPG